jgi:hypothetical protein
MTVNRMESTDISILILYLQDHSGAFIECTPKHNIQSMEYSETNIMKSNIESALLDLGSIMILQKY